MSIRSSVSSWDIKVRFWNQFTPVHVKFPLSDLTSSLRGSPDLGFIPKGINKDKGERRVCLVPWVG